MNRTTLTPTLTRVFPFAVVATTLIGCVGAGGRIGYRTDILGQDEATAPSDKQGVYGGPVVDTVFYHPDRPLEERAIYVGFQWAYMFSGGRRYNFHTLLPMVGYFRNGWKSDRVDDDFVSSLGGFLATGLEIQHGAFGFHTALCGGTFNTVQGYGCGRISTLGYVGVDVSLAVAPPIHAEVLRGLGYMLL